jgi:hypothetical protein
MRKLYGVAIVDPELAGSMHRKEIETVWSSMIRRCLAEEHRSRYPSYASVEVSNEWLRFSRFYWWAVEQDWKGKRLDKDLLSGSVKIYSDKTCAFISQALNGFLIEGGAKGLPDGVYNTPSGLFKPLIHKSPITGKKAISAEFSCPLEAHAEWKKQKHKIALEYSLLETDARIKAALENRYLK